MIPSAPVASLTFVCVQSDAHAIVPSVKGTVKVSVAAIDVELYVYVAENFGTTAGEIV